MRTSLLLVLLLAAAPAMADTYAFGMKVVVSGDGPGKVTQVAGKPDRVVELENNRGAVYGERWEYYIDGKTVSITFIDGKVTRITENR
ncbi:MAG: DUF2845 domain-containing protein [Pseudoxanthomonas sp.]